MSVSKNIFSRLTETTVGRLIAGLALGAFVTVGLLWTMQYLIATADRSLDEEVSGSVVDFVRLKRDEVINRKSLKPEKPPLPKAPPPQPPQPKLDNVDPQVEKMDIGEVDINPEVELSAEGFSLDASEGDYLPIIKVAPIYPRRAASRGIEGYVILEFTVTRKGTVKDVKIIESKPRSSIFHRAAKRAVLKFKYKPRVSEGKTVEVKGVRNLIRFELED